jgi:uncharacterized membrane protein
VKLEYLYKGLPGHPIHPPLTDAAIGAYTFATAAAVLQVVGVLSHNGAIAWWIGLVIGLVFGALAATTGFAEWLTLTWGTPLWRTVTTHMLVMVGATVLFLIAVLIGHKGYTHRHVDTGPFIVTVLGFVTLTVGGWLGGAVVFVHGMRVLNLVDEPALKAATPVVTPEKEAAEGG